MTIRTFPPLIAACCVTIYWATVVVKSILISRVIRKDPNVIPRERTGQFMRLFWGPLLGTWIVYPWFHLSRSLPTGPAWMALGWCGAVACVFALSASYHCWHEMGASWRIGIDPNEKTAMIASGAYKWLRHPIYALSILLVLGTLAAVPTWVMLVVALCHATLMQIEARREEKYMLRAHGETYAGYMKTTGRFLPRF
jgi:protein-S-isoprenylcysteine O-methyltransferase Ste14